MWQYRLVWFRTSVSSFWILYVGIAWNTLDRELPIESSQGILQALKKLRHISMPWVGFESIMSVLGWEKADCMATVNGSSSKMWKLTLIWVGDLIVPVMQLKSLVDCSSSYGIFNIPNIGVILEVGAALRWSLQSLVVGWLWWWHNNGDSKDEDNSW